MQGSRVRLSAPSPTPRPERPRRATTRAPLFQTKCHGRPGVGHRPKMRQSRGQRGVRRQKSAAGGGARGANLAPPHSIPGVPSLLLCPPPPSSAREDVPPGPRALKGAGIPGHPRLRGRPLTPALPSPTFAARPRLPSPITRGACAGLLELSAPAGLTQSGEPEGAGNRLLLDWRQKQPVGGRS